ncbi:uncharacterized protein [Apostichopus japonicus]|uniref:uncharacterized protein isoform X1 n=2 Tax=Stichopus japonicus TaxID=307972 RepID=UPI003AB5B913
MYRSVTAFFLRFLRRNLTKDKSTMELTFTMPPENKFGHRLLTEEFPLKPNYAYCNSGAYGLVPRIVTKKQLEYMRERDEDPDGWYRFSKEKLLYLDAIKQLAEFVGSEPSNLVFVENASTGTNTALNSIRFQTGDKILFTSHGYAAVAKNVANLRKRAGITEVCLDLKLPIRSEDDIISQFERVISENEGIKVALIDHITCPSAILMPLKSLIDLCHRNGILVIVDGAHAPGHIPLNLEELSADFYTGNIHKWLFSPRGCALFWVHPNHHDSVSPLVVSRNHERKTLVERFIPDATRDSSAYLVVPDALRFHKSLGGLDVILRRNRDSLRGVAKLLAESWNSEVYPLADHLRAPNMALVAMPSIFQELFEPSDANCTKMMEWLHGKNVFVCFSSVSGKIWARLSMQVWNCFEDYLKVRDAVHEMKEEVPYIIEEGKFSFELKQSKL